MAVGQGAGGLTACYPTSQHHPKLSIHRALQSPRLLPSVPVCPVIPGISLHREETHTQMPSSLLPHPTCMLRPMVTQFSMDARRQAWHTASFTTSAGTSPKASLWTSGLQAIRACVSGAWNASWGCLQQHKTAEEKACEARRPRRKGL